VTAFEFWQLAYLTALLQTGSNDAARAQADTASYHLERQRAVLEGQEDRPRYEQ
jgi:hypothetical protein